MNPNDPIHTIMTTEVITVDQNDTLSTIQELFKAYRFHHLPVIDNPRRLVGIISELDIRRAYELLMYQASGNIWTKDELNDLKAEDIMTPNPTILSPSDSIHKAADIFLYNKYHALPVVEYDDLVGIVTVHDLLAYYFDWPGNG